MTTTPTTISDPIPPEARPWLNATLRAALIVWAVAWSLFALGVASQEGGRGWLYAGGWVVVLAALAAIPHRWPRVGAVLLIVAGMFAGFFFDHWLTRISLAFPAVAMGALIGWRAQKV